MQIRSRIIELRTVDPAEVAPNPRNWRTHPQAQRDALRGVLADIGIAAPVIAYHSDAHGGLMLIDGHERMTVGIPFPAVILDVSDAEAATLLATFDPLGAMAETDGDALRALLDEVSTDSPAVAAMLDALAQGAGVVPGADGEPVDPTELWKGMPDFEQEDKAWKTLTMYFTCEEDYRDFQRLIGQELTEKSTFAWHPAQDAIAMKDYQCE